MVKKSYIDVYHDYRGSIHCWTRDENGKLEYEIHDEADYSYLFMPDNTGEGEFIDMKKKPMKKVFFESYEAMRDYGKGSNITCESDVPLINKFILDNFADVDASLPYNTAFYDIEVDVNLDEGRGYSSIQDPFSPITSISLIDLSKKKYHMLMLTSEDMKLTDDEFPVENHVFLSERELLRKFCEIIEDIDIFAGWNTEFYDLNYIMERMIKCFGEKQAKTMLCRNGLKARRREVTNEWEEEVWVWDLRGRKHLDLMAIYKKFKPKGLESAKLSAICLKELGLDKIDYDGDLGELYRENPVKFFEYSLHDSRLLYLLDKKLNLIKISMMFTRDSCVLVDDVTGTVKPIETAFLKFCRKVGNIVLPDKKENKKEAFRGAVVYDTITGLKKRLFSIDLTSLYPSIMIMLGLSSENLVMQLVGEDLDYYKVIQRQNTKVDVDIDGEIHNMFAWEVDDIIKENGFTISAAGTVFDGTLGLLSQFVKAGFDDRKKYKKMMSDFFEAGDKENGERYNLLQSVRKLANNSLYGCISNAGFRLFDIRMARSITYTGALVSKFMTFRTNETLKELANV